MTAFGCVFSITIELAYHLNSPSYRRGDDADDPLHKTKHQWDPKSIEDSTLDDETRKMLNTENADDDMVKKIEEHRQAHRGPWWRSYTWPYSTQKNVHAAAVNGILAGENRRTVPNVSAIDVGFSFLNMAVFSGHFSVTSADSGWHIQRGLVYVRARQQNSVILATSRMTIIHVYV